jgi:hypothetical protein
MNSEESGLPSENVILLSSNRPKKAALAKMPRSSCFPCHRSICHYQLPPLSGGLVRPDLLKELLGVATSKMVPNGLQHSVDVLCESSLEVTGVQLAAHKVSLHLFVGLVSVVTAVLRLPADSNAFGMLAEDDVLGPVQARVGLNDAGRAVGLQVGK